ncbi:MAG: peptidoglycan-binding domain-containing protein [Candidatus Korobacteraceae bacterium]
MPIGKRNFQVASILLALLLMASTAYATTTTKTKTKHPQVTKTRSSSHHSGKSKTTKSASRSHGQRGIDEQRTTEIQNALIKEHYLTGEPSGTWDAATRDAMTRYQAANGWQTKLTPDSRALIKLGLGPDHKGLLNPETANIPSPHELGVDSETQPGGSTDQQ